MRYEMPSFATSLSAGGQEFFPDADGYIDVGDDLAAAHTELQDPRLHGLTPLTETEVTAAVQGGAVPGGKEEKSALRAWLTIHGIPHSGRATPSFLRRQVLGALDALDGRGLAPAEPAEPQADEPPAAIPANLDGAA
jgi:hypothetical protein